MHDGLHAGVGCVMHAWRTACWCRTCYACMMASWEWKAITYPATSDCVWLGGYLGSGGAGLSIVQHLQMPGGLLGPIQQAHSVLEKWLKPQMGIACQRMGHASNTHGQLAAWHVLLGLPLFRVSYNPSCDKLSSGSSFVTWQVGCWWVCDVTP